MPPTRPNRTRMATAADEVITPTSTACWIIKHFNPSGVILDPAAGTDSFYAGFPVGHTRYRCEIKDGIDFFEWDMPVDWVITNPPYSIYDHFLQHAFEIAKNVVFFTPLAKALKSQRILKMVENYGGLKEIVCMGGGNAHGFNFGFPVGCLHYQSGYCGLCTISDWAKAAVDKSPRVWAVGSGAPGQPWDKHEAGNSPSNTRTEAR